MKQYLAEDIQKLTLSHGRTWCQTAAEGEGILWFNWTCSGFTVHFTGASLTARIKAVPNEPPAFPGAQPMPLEHPCFGVVGEDGETLTKRFECVDEEASYVLFAGETGTHTLRIVKLSEGSRGQTGLLSLETDGELLPAEVPEKKMSIEFVGDSITCGYGNECPNRDEHFRTTEENGWMTYGAIAGRKLGAEFNMISYSGICTSQAEKSLFPMHLPSMDELYAYTDRGVQEKFGLEPEPWDFAANKKDIVFLNLGTNDVNPIRFARDLETAAREEIHFKKQYKAFLQELRRLNGPDTWIICTLGPLDYYLYDCIREAVEIYREEAGDRRIRVFKLIGVNLITEGFGADGHPSLKTHERLGAQLAEILRNAESFSDSSEELKGE